MNQHPTDVLDAYTQKDSHHTIIVLDVSHYGHNETAFDV